MKLLCKMMAGFFIGLMLFGCSSNNKVNQTNDISVAKNTTAQNDVQQTEQIKEEKIKETQYIYDPNAIKIVIDGQELKTTSPPESKNGTTMVPFRDIFNALGVSNDEIKWNDENQSIMVNHNDNIIFIMIDNLYAVANDKQVKLPTTAYINQNGVTMVPVRFISESLNAYVRWDGQTRSVKITT